MSFTRLNFLATYLRNLGPQDTTTFVLVLRWTIIFLAKSDYLPPLIQPAIQVPRIEISYPREHLVAHAKLAQRAPFHINSINTTMTLPEGREDRRTNACYGCCGNFVLL